MAGSGPVGVGIIGAGVISDTYLENLNSLPRHRGAGRSATSIPEVAEAKAAEHDVPSCAAATTRC